MAIAAAPDCVRWQSLPLRAEPGGNRCRADHTNLLPLWFKGRRFSFAKDKCSSHQSVPVRTIWTGTALVPKEVLPRLRQWRGGTETERRQQLDAGTARWTGTALVPKEVLPRLRQWRGGTGAERRQQLDAGTARTNDIQINPIVLDNTTVKAYDLFI